MSRLKVLLSAYACEPGEGSEPGVGWNVAMHTAQHHDVWVLTRANNRPRIEDAFSHMGAGRAPTFLYVDLPEWARGWKRGQRGIHLYYYLWQQAAYREARRLVSSVPIDVVHHVTFVKYWAPSFMYRLGVPFVWGPVGGGETAPPALVDRMPREGRRYEAQRQSAQRTAEKDPFLRSTADAADLALATTAQTASRMVALGASDVDVRQAIGISQGEFDRAEAAPLVGDVALRFVSVGRLLHWKGFDLGLDALEAAGCRGASYEIVGDGPAREYLEDKARSLGVQDRVNFRGRCSRERTLEILAGSDCLVHPSLHESGGLVCLEAMAHSRPVVCLDLGGPGIQVTRDTGFAVPASGYRDSVDALASAMQRLATEPGLARKMGAAGRSRVEHEFLWSTVVERYSRGYQSVVRRRRAT